MMLWQIWGLTIIIFIIQKFQPRGISAPDVPFFTVFVKNRLHFRVQ